MGGIWSPGKASVTSKDIVSGLGEYLRESKILCLERFNRKDITLERHIIEYYGRPD